MTEIRTPLLTRICTNTGLNIEKNRHEEQRELHNMIYKIRWMYQENQDTLLEQTFFSGHLSEQESAMKKESS